MVEHVVFGTGAVGVAIASELVAEGKGVRVVSRSGGSGLPEGVEVARGDATDPAFATAAAKGASVIYFALAPPYNRWPELFPPLQNSIIAAASASGARLISVENMYAYGDVDGQPLVEDLPYRATGKKGKVRGELATALLNAHDRGEITAAIARASDFFGPRARMSQMGERVFYPALNGGKAQFLMNIDQPHTYTYIGDLAHAMITLGDRPEALGGIWHVPNPPTVTTRQFVEMVYEEAGTAPAKISVMPRLMRSLVGLFMPVVRELKELDYEFEKPHVVDHSKIANAFGLEPTPVRDAIRSTLDWYRANPK